MTFRHLSHLLLCAGLAILPCAAQEGATVTLHFLSFPRAIDPAAVELRVGEAQTIKIEAPSNEISGAYKVARQSAWVVGETVVGKDGKPTFNVLGQAASLAAPEQLILLIRKGKDNAAGFEVTPIDNQVGQFGKGKFLFMNAAKIDIAGLVGAEKFALKPGRHTIIKPKPDPADAKLCHTTLYFRKDDKAKAFFSSTWPLSDDARGLIFIYHDPDTNRLRLHTIRDFP